jgi:hypothetical protein
MASEPVAPIESACSTAPVSSFERRRFHEAQDLYVLTGPWRAEVGLEAPAQHREALGEVPALERAGDVEGTGLSFQEGQVVAGIEADLFFRPAPRMGGHDVCADEQAHLFDPTEGGDVVMGEGSRHRVVVAVESHERQRVGPASVRPGAPRRTLAGSANMAAWSTSRRSAFVSGFPRTRRNRSA